jgi:hypothetical protein
MLLSKEYLDFLLLPLFVIIRDHFNQRVEDFLDGNDGIVFKEQ